MAAPTRRAAAVVVVLVVVMQRARPCRRLGVAVLLQRDVMRWHASR